MTGDLPAYERGTGFLLARTGSLAARSWSAFLDGHGLTQGQYTAMTAIKERGPMGQRRLAEIVAVDARNIVGVLDSLETKGLVERRADASDRRRRIVALTDGGTALMDEVADSAAAEQERFLHALSRDERVRLNRLLSRLYVSHVPE